MRIVRKSGTNKFKNSDKCLAIEYPLNDKEISAATIILKGRYPDKGYATNLKSREMAYVVKGSGELVVERKTVKLKEGDIVLIEAKERFYWKGNMTLFMPCTPPFDPKQHKIVDGE